ncbi:hypothetical protein MMC30_007068 [Trapelia coarctata]|nr:hypothetical protein [Trapelia coarctata]
MPDMLPGRRTTRSMSRDSTPVEIPIIADGAAPRGNTTRRMVPNAHSSAYGSLGRSSAPVELNPALADMNPIDALRAAVQIADARPIGRSGTKSQTVDDDLPAIQEEYEVRRSREDLYNIEQEYSGVDDSSDSEKENEAVHARGHGDVETRVHGSGNQIPWANERDSRSFGTEDPILGAGKTAQAKAGPPDTTGLTEGKRADLINRYLSEDQLLRERDHAQQHRQESSGPSPLVTNLLRLVVLALFLFVCYQVASHFPRFNALFNISNITDYKARPVAIVHDAQFNNILERLQRVEDTLHVQPSQYMEPDRPRINFFSPGVGAMVDPHLTSPSNKHSYLARAWHHWGLGKYKGKTPGPGDALTPWEDVGDCWCAAPSGGKSQLAVMLPHRIIPTHLVVEHVQKGLTLGIGAAPRDMELWVQILDEKQRDSVQAAANAVLRHSTRGSEDGPGALSASDDYEAQKSLDRTWVRIASFAYDIDAPRHIQTFKIDFQLDYWGLAANKVAVRVKNNWGPSEYTCLYRLKLHGHLAEPPRDEFAPESLLEKAEQKKSVR